MGVAAAIGAVATIGSAVIGSSASSNAANAQTQAAQTAANTQLSMYNQTRSDLAPYSQAGASAFSQLSNLFGFGGGAGAAGSTTSAAPTTQSIYVPGVGNVQIPSTGATGTAATTGAAGTGATGIPNTAAMTTALESTPGYQFTLNQGTQALDRSAASKGLVLSGAQLKDSQNYGQGLAQANAWNPYVQELNTAASLGESAASQTGNAGAAAASGAAASQLAGGQSQAAGIVGGANQLTSGLNQLSSQLQNAPTGAYGIVSPNAGLQASAANTITSNASIF